MATQIELQLENVSKTFKTRHGNLAVLHDINLEILKGELVCLLGQSGCGKSTLLQIAAGLEKPTSGRVFAVGGPVTGPNHRVGMVFQGFSLFPWLNVTENVAFGLKARGVKNFDRRIDRTLQLVGLKGFERASPHQLSGGMAQRVALARMIVNRPDVVLLDEPFSALDAFTRMSMQDELVSLWYKTQLTTLFVTHDLDEAIYLGDRVIILTPRPGQIMHSFTVSLPRPRDRSHADFLTLRAEIYRFLEDQPAPA